MSTPKSMRKKLSRLPPFRYFGYKFAIRDWIELREPSVAAELLKTMRFARVVSHRGHTIRRLGVFWWSPPTRTMKPWAREERCFARLKRGRRF